MRKSRLREVKRVVQGHTAGTGTQVFLQPRAVFPKPTRNLLVSFHLDLLYYVNSLTQCDVLHNIFILLFKFNIC